MAVASIHFTRGLIALQVRSEMKVTRLCPTVCDPVDYSPWSPVFLQEHWNVQPFPFPRDLPNQAIEFRSPELQVDSLPADPRGKPKNTVRATKQIRDRGRLINKALAYAVLEAEESHHLWSQRPEIPESRSCQFQSGPEGRRTPRFQLKGGRNSQVSLHPPFIPTQLWIG